jgi:putative transposase
MKKAHFSDSQILAILKQAENSVPIPELCREHGISNSSFYKWRSKYGGKDAFLYLRNVKGYPWNHKRGYRIYRELELNLRIKHHK